MTRNWEYYAAHRQQPTTPNPNLMGNRDSNRTEEQVSNTAFPTGLMENTGDIRHKSQATQETMMATPGVNLEALANFQAWDLQKLIKNLQGLAAARTETTSSARQPPHVSVATTGEEEAILW